MENIIYKVLTDFSSEQKQLNFDSESARRVLAKKITQAIHDSIKNGLQS